MPRIRALVLLGLFLVNQAACTSWQVPLNVTPQEYVTQHPDKELRVTPKDELGKSQSSMVLTNVRFSADSVFGRDSESWPTAYNLRHVATFEVRVKDGVRTALLVVAVPLVAVGVLAAFAYADDSPTFRPGTCLFTCP